MTQRDNETSRPSANWVASVWSGFKGGRASPIIASIDRRLVRLGLYRADTRPLGKLQSFLAVWAFVVVALVLLHGAMELWEDGGGRGSLVVEILAWIAWIVRTLSIVILISVIWAAVHEWSVSRDKQPTQL